MNLNVVVLHWEDVAATSHCVASVETAAQIAVENCSTRIIVVDNGSKKPLALADLSNCSATRIQLIRNQENLGFAGGMNIGIHAAKAAETDAIWLLNNDTRLEPNAINAMAIYLGENPDVACVGSVILNGDGTKISTIGGYKFQPWLSRALPIGSGIAPQLATEALQNFDYVCGSAIMLAPAYVKKLSALPNYSFLYFEELYLSRILNEHGLKTGVCSEAWVMHTQGVSTSKLGSQQRSYFVTLSALQYTRRFHPLCIPTVLVARLARACQSSLAHWRLSFLSGCLKAIFHFFSASYSSSDQK